MNQKTCIRLMVHIIIMSLIFIWPVMSDVPTTMNYQGLLTAGAGSPVVDGDYSVTFTIYDADIGGNSKWTEIQLVSTTEGLFSALLGSVNPIIDSVFADTSRYLGIQIGGDPELTPRSKLSTVAYAFRTATLDGANGGQLTGSVAWDNFMALVDDPMMYLFDPEPTTPSTRKIFAHSPSLQSLGLEYNSSNESFEFSFGGPVMTIEMLTHKVGIGTDSPDSELDIVGTLRAQGVELGVNPTRSGFQSTIGGGGLNTVSANWATVAGGQQNVAGGQYSTSSGGHSNTANGDYSVVPGGRLCDASAHYAFAAGRRAKATHDGSFVWADSTNLDFSSSAAGQFQIRATGGANIYTDASLTAGVTLVAGGSSWSAVCDSALKRNIREVDCQEILAKVAELPISQWSYESQVESIEHVGPMAQDFYRLFGLGEDDKHINTLDPDGISLAAIKALIEKNNKLETEVSELRELVERLLDTKKTPFNMN